MLALADSRATQWFWCGGTDNPANLTTRAGCESNDLDSKCWRHDKFISYTNVFFGCRVLTILAGSQANQWFRCGGPDNPADLTTRAGCKSNDLDSRCWHHGLVVDVHMDKKDEHNLASPPGDHKVIEDDLAGHMNQGPEQPLVQDQVEEEEYHDALEA